MSIMLTLYKKIIYVQSVIIHICILGLMQLAHIVNEFRFIWWFIFAQAIRYCSCHKYIKKYNGCHDIWLNAIKLSNFFIFLLMITNKIWIEVLNIEKQVMNPWRTQKLMIHVEGSKTDSFFYYQYIILVLISAYTKDNKQN